MDDKERLSIHGIDPVVTGGAKTEFLARNIMAWQLGLITIVDTHMAIDIERACLLGSHFHPLPAQLGAPLLRAVIRREQTNLIAECAHLRHPIQSQQFTPLSRGAITQRLNEFQTGKRHESQQQKQAFKSIIPFGQFKETLCCFE